MRVLIAPDKFKGSLSAIDAAEAIRAGWRKVMPSAEFDLVPIADGGEGTAAVFHQVLGGEWISMVTEDARERSIQAEYLWLADRRTAVIDMSAAAGLAQLPSADHDPWRATTRGCGRMVLDAIRRGAVTVYLGLGGSATNDAGAGFATALGWRLLDAEGRTVPPRPETFSNIIYVVPPENPLTAKVIGMADVTHPLLGPMGCSAVFAPQKGARAEDLPALDAALRHFSDCIESGSKWREVPGSGAAGGLGFGVLAFTNGKIESGFSILSELLNLPERVRQADYAITGEGRLDAQTLGGKGPFGVAALGRTAGKPVIAFAGIVEGAARDSGRFDQIVALMDGSLSAAESLARARELLTDAAERTARAWMAP